MMDNHISLSPGNSACRRSVFVLQGYYAYGSVFHGLPYAFRPILNSIHRYFLVTFHGSNFAGRTTDFYWPDGQADPALSREEQLSG